MARISIKIGSVEVNGKRVGAVSGFEYDGPPEGLDAALRLHTIAASSLDDGVPRCASCTLPKSEHIGGLGSCFYYDAQGVRRFCRRYRRVS